MRNAKSLLMLSAVCVTVGVTGIAASATVAPVAEIGTIGYNANGADVPANAWKEYFDVRNVSGHAVNVKGWSTQDTWADRTHGDKPDAADCNTSVWSAGAGAGHFQFLGADNPDTAEVEAEGLWLPAGHTVRVYTGGGVDRRDDELHTIALNKWRCGYKSHYLGNLEDGVKVKAADGALVASKGYSFENGYYVR
jgi:hypothetical protein